MCVLGSLGILDNPNEIDWVVLETWPQFVQYIPPRRIVVDFVERLLTDHVRRSEFNVGSEAWQSRRDGIQSYMDYMEVAEPSLRDGMEHIWLDWGTDGKDFEIVA